MSQVIYWKVLAKIVGFLPATMAVPTWHFEGVMADANRRFGRPVFVAMASSHPFS
jgi:hypothetical protein